MDRMIYLAMSGAKQTLVAQTARAHNLANVSTAGFRADLSQFRSMPVIGTGQPSRTYALAERPGVDFSPGTVRNTGRPLDVALNGPGWIAVQAPDGSEAYTRAGDLRITSTGLMTTGAGHPVLGNGGPIAIPPSQSLEIGSDGTVSIRPLGQAPDTLAEVDRLKLVNPPVELLRKGPDGLFRTTDGVPAEPDATVGLTSGALEGSNVRAVSALVDMIQLARKFEMQVRMMRVAEENDAASSRMMELA